MPTDHEPHLLPADPASLDDPQVQAREAVEAMREAGTLTPEVERALLGGAKRHARFVNDVISEPPE